MINPSMRKKLPESNCPACNALCNAAGIPQDESAVAGPGNFVVCIECGELNIFDVAMRLRTPTTAELDTLSADELMEVSLYKRAVAAVSAILDKES
jgi:hypothetical protein